MLTLAAGCATPAGGVHPSAPEAAARATRERAERRPSPAVRQLQRDLAAVFTAPIMAHAQWGVAIRSLDSGEALFDLNSQKLMMPASNMKIVTLAGAARLLTWDYRFITTLETSAPIDNGILRGDLVVRGGGDPTINGRNNRNLAFFDECAGALRAAGIRGIEGRILGDDSAFDDEGLGGGWAWDYLQFGYAAPIGALQYNENVAQLTAVPGARAGEAADVRLTPGSGLSLLNRTATGAAGVPETIAYRRHLDRPVLEVTGTVPLPAPPAAGAPELAARTATRQVAVVNPTVFFAQSLKDGLVAREIPVAGEAADVDELEPVITAQPGGPPRRVLAELQSAPLRDIAPVLMKASQNQYAETLLKAAGGAGTAEAGRAAVLRTLREWQLDERSLVLADGSGLSRYNYVTPGLLVAILQRMYTDQAHREAFLASFPLAGQEGTLAARLRRTRAEGNALAKTGSISNVRALSGYVRTRDGEMLAFAILANDFVIPSASVNWITDLGVEVLANFTRKSGH